MYKLFILLNISYIQIPTNNTGRPASYETFSQGRCKHIPHSQASLGSVGSQPNRSFRSRTETMKHDSTGRENPESGIQSAGGYEERAVIERASVPR